MSLHNWTYLPFFFLRLRVYDRRGFFLPAVNECNFPRHMNRFSLVIRIMSTVAVPRSLQRKKIASLSRVKTNHHAPDLGIAFLRGYMYLGQRLSQLHSFLVSRHTTIQHLATLRLAFASQKAKQRSCLAAQGYQSLLETLANKPYRQPLTTAMCNPPPAILTNNSLERKKNVIM